MNFIAAAALIERYGDAGGVARYIVGQILADPESEAHWRATAAACHELLTAKIH
ncbi:hypothetical protein [Sphingomonas aerophila]|uniref:Uncharacterized protein n=1 Tax=Sphingomonas aerophila TaxID=1344948 RepID=A0A7W9BCN7_9SPHN|nr:hypothetical protein [Sphingomonas aerophila]MBB5714790.1 hypothetical protein [Sphingomonas aerophila]